MFFVIYLANGGSLKTRDEKDVWHSDQAGIEGIESLIKEGQPLVCTMRFPDTTYRLKEAAQAVLDEYGDDDMPGQIFGDLKDAMEQVHAGKDYEVKIKWKAVLAIGAFGS